MQKIALKILHLIESKTVFSDLQIKPGFKLAYRSPRGYQSYGDDTLTQKDIEEFATFADKEWTTNLEKGKGQFDTSFTLQGAARLRCNFFRFGHDNELGIVARKHPLDIPDIGTLGAPPKLRHLVNIRSKGLILVTGPFGSGKSTTIAALLEHINNTMAASIVTLEDPIEYQMESKKSIITQREIPTNVSTFSDGLMAAKRQRPDIIMVGEMRDRDTIEAGIMAADSGCLVMASTHGRSATEAVESLLSYFSGTEQDQKRNMLANSIVAVVSQVLMPSKDGKQFVLAYEMMVNNPGAAMLIRENKLTQLKTNIQSSARDGSVILNDVLSNLVTSGKIERDDAIYEAYDKEGMSKQLNGGKSH